VRRQSEAAAALWISFIELYFLFWPKRRHATLAALQSCQLGELDWMKKKTVITTEKFEVWVIPEPSEAPAAVARALETDCWESDSSNESLTPLPEEHPDKNVPPTQED
jgi:hypothetical protein